MRLAYHFQLRTELFADLLAFFLILTVIAPLHANAASIDFTRHLSTYSNNTDNPLTHQDTFFGVPGSARLIVTSSGKTISANIQLNGTEVVGADSFTGAGEFEVPVTLVKDNALSVTLNGTPGGSLTIRVKQVADIELNIEARLHFNTNVSSFKAAREFYYKLGFDTLTGFPDTNTQAMARSMGVKTPTSYDGSRGGEVGSYLLHGELLGMSVIKFGGDALKGGLIDLIEFSIPRNDDPPYAKLNHLGIARAAMYTRDIAADYKYMVNAGVKFISAPATRSDGTKFAIFTDLDGTHYELIEKVHEAFETENTHIFSLAQVNVNVSDFERSSAWYQMLGYDVSRKLAATDSVEVANAMGFEEKFEIEGAIVTNPIDGSELELVQWISPHNPGRAYGIPVNHFGIHRMAFSTTDIEADVAALRAQGVRFVSDITPCCFGPDSSGSIVAFYDPDGAIMELAQQNFWSKLRMMMGWLIDKAFE